MTTRPHPWSDIAREIPPVLAITHHTSHILQEIHLNNDEKSHESHKSAENGGRNTWNRIAQVKKPALDDPAATCDIFVIACKEKLWEGDVRSQIYNIMKKWKWWVNMRRRDARVGESVRYIVRLVRAHHRRRRELAPFLKQRKKKPQQQRRRNETQLLALKRIVPTYYTGKGPLGI